MSQRKKGNGYEEVRRYILERIENRKCRQDPFVRISGREVAEAAGISPQAVNEHIRTLIRRGVIRRDGRFYFTLGNISEQRPTVTNGENATEMDLPTISACFRMSADSYGDH